MTKPINFPGRKQSRRQDALNRLLTRWYNVHTGAIPAQVRHEMSILAERLTAGFGSFFTKKDRSASGQLRRE